MSDMQKFHNELKSTAKESGAYKRQLVLISQASRDRIVQLAGELGWVIWNSDKPAGAR
jgi:hypothetical protein